MITIKNAQHPTGITGRFEKFEGNMVLVRYKTDGGWSRCYRYLKTDIVAA